METPKINEKISSQIPALQELINLGYTYLSPSQALHERGNNFGNVLLEDILREQLKKINRINHKGGEYPFSEANIQTAIEKIKSIGHDGLLKSNSDIYDWLTLGTSLEQSINGDSKSFTLNYIDWAEPSNNTFHATAEFSVERTRSKETVRPDIVLFVNGIPLAVIECKASDHDSDEGVSQMIRNQQEDYIPNLFAYAQLLMSVSKNEAQYATVGTRKRFWSQWTELDADYEAGVEAAINNPLTEEQKDALFSEDFASERQYFEELGDKSRMSTEQDKAIYSLCHPERFFELIKLYILFDAGVKKIARYQQFFVTRNALERVKEFDSEGRRKGGMVWHTQGSGKSLTMVWIARLLALDKEIKNARIIVVTDRTDLDRQIKKVFMQCHLEPERAKTGRDLAKLIKSKAPIITTLVHKFEAAMKSKSVSDDDPNIFLLVDESHRTQFGELAARMRQALPNACYIGFTGTPLTKEDKSNFAVFGDLIEPPYPIRVALQDRAVVPLVYEGRSVLPKMQDGAAVDLWFERYTADLNKKQKADLKKKYARANQISKVDEVVYMRALDISRHYCSFHKGPGGFKAQLVAPDKATAIKYHEYLQKIGDVSSEVVISSPDLRKGYGENDKEPDTKVRKFWEKMMKRFGDESKYETNITNSFTEKGEPEILIVVDKLLTGFDAPPNTVLYLCKKMRGHGLLQAIARVNRLHEGKDCGYIIDYEGILGELDDALAEYDALQGFDDRDLADTLMSIDKEAAKLPQQHSDLWDVFREVKNKKDEEELEVLLADDAKRSEFYQLLNDFQKTFATARTSHKFLSETDEETLKQYKDGAKNLERLRQSVRIRYGEGIDYRKAEPKIRKMLNDLIQAEEAQLTGSRFNIFQRGGGSPSAEDGAASTSASASAEDEERLFKNKSDAAKADRIAHRMKREITEKMEEDPAFYKKFSELIEEAIKGFRQGRLNEKEYLQEVTDLEARYHNNDDDSTPKELLNNAAAAAFFRAVRVILADSKSDEQVVEKCSVDIALEIGKVLKAHHKVHFWDDRDSQNRAINDIEDYLYDEIEGERGLDLQAEQISEIIGQTMSIAKKRAG